MTEQSVTIKDEAVTIEFDEALYARDSIFGAAYIFIDRCYVHLDRPHPGRIAVTLKPKPSAEQDPEALAGEFENELLGQAWRRLITDENRLLIEQVTTRALSGAAGPPGLDELMDLEIGDETAFDDPLGIAMSWEEKYKSKNRPKPSESEQESG